MTRQRQVYTIEHAQSLWGGAVSPDAPASLSIKGAARASDPNAATRLLLRKRRVAEADAKEVGGDKHDFELLQILGKGGMGVVYSARQASLDRNVAIKMIRAESARKPVAKNKFMAEALVTGELDHPNIVPIYDLGGTKDGLLFYAMKEVRGTSWDKTIRDKTEAENLETLLRVCDAVAFAHDKGVIHRDLKPENVMVGDYGEVLVMDWGLAASTTAGVTNVKAPELTDASGRAGTPAYMAPEMALCEIDKIGPASDVYLLGGILYEIATGLRPHAGKTAFSCLCRAMANDIQPTDKKGELVAIALKAMATAPQARYANVKELQAAVRDYGQHAESLTLSAAAANRLEGIHRIREGEQYRECTEVIAGFQQALELWPGNANAVRGLRQVRETLAQLAIRRGDLALAQSELSAIEADRKHLAVGKKRLPEPSQLAERVAAAVSQTRRKEAIARVSRWGAVAAGVLVVFVVMIAYLTTKVQRDRAVEAEQLANDQRDKALKAQADLEQAQAKIVAERDKALAAEKAARLAQAQEAEQRKMAESALTRMRTAQAAEQAAKQETAKVKVIAGKDKLQLSSEKEWEEYANKILLAQASGVTADMGNMARYLNDCPARFRGWEWGRLRYLLTLTKPAASASGTQVAAIDCSLDGQRIAARCYDGTVKVWSLGDAGPELIYDIAAHKGNQGIALNPDSVAFSPDGKLLASAGGLDQTLKIWDMATGEERLSIDTGKYFVVSAAFSPDGKRVVSASANKTEQVNVWDVDTGEQLLAMGKQEPRRTVWFASATYSPDGRRIAAGCTDHNVYVWDAQSGRQSAVLRGHRDCVEGVAFHPSGGLLASFARANTIKVWNLSQGRVVANLTGYAGQITHVAFNRSGARLVSASEDRTVRLWTTAGWRQIKTFKGHTDAATSVAFLPNDGAFASGGKDGTVRFWSMSAAKDTTVLKGHSKWVFGVAFDPRGKQVATASEDKTVRIWDPSTGRVLRTLRGHEGRVADVAYSPTGRLASCGGFGDASVIVWNVATGEKLVRIKTKDRMLECVAFDPFDRWVAAGGYSGRIGMWDASTGRFIRWCGAHGPSEMVSALCPTPDGKRLFSSALGDKVIRVWDLASQKELLQLKGHEHSVLALALSPDGKRLASGSVDKTVRVWDTATGELLKTMQGHRGNVQAVAFTPDGERIVSGSDDRTIKVWQAHTGRQMMSMSGHSDAVTSIALSPDGKRLASGSMDWTARVWPALDWKTVE